MESIIAGVKDDLINFVTKKGFRINGNALNILMEVEEQCYQRNIASFASDLLLPLIKKSPEFSKVIDKHGGDTILATKFLESLLDKDRKSVV